MLYRCSATCPGSRQIELASLPRFLESTRGAAGTVQYSTVPVASSPDKVFLPTPFTFAEKRKDNRRETGIPM